MDDKNRIQTIAQPNDGHLHIDRLQILDSVCYISPFRNECIDMGQSQLPKDRTNGDLLRKDTRE